MKKLFSRFSLTMSLVLFVFLMMLCSTVIVALIILLLFKTGMLQYFPRFPEKYRLFGPILLLLFISILTGTMLTGISSKRATRPYKMAIEAFNRVASGDFTVELKFKHVPYELEELTKSFNRMTKELSGIETLRSDFINHFSHEFKTPIVSIQGFAKLLENPNLSEEERQKYVAIIIQESGRLTTLSSTILHLSKVENHEIISEKRAIQLDEQLRQTILLLEPKWQKKRIIWELELDDSILNSDEDLLQQMWINLLDNAIKFSPENGVVKVKLMNLTDTVIVKITDQGSGMSSETQQRLFDKFYQGDASHSKEGNGLGMSLLKNILRICDGEIGLKSSLGNGSSFTITLKK